MVSAEFATALEREHRRERVPELLFCGHHLALFGSKQTTSSPSTPSSV